MKKITALAAIMGCIVIMGCSRDKAFLGMEFHPGAVHEYTVSTTQILSQSMMGETLELTQTLTWMYVLRVVDVDEQSIATIDILFDEIGLESQGPFGPMSYRSWEHEGDVPQSVRAFTVLLDKRVTMRVSHDGRIISITGTDAIIDEMIAMLGVGNDTVMIEKARSDLRNQFGDEAMIESLQKVFPVYSEHPVGIGDAWGGETRFSKGLPMIVRNTWRVAAIQDRSMIIEAYGIIEPNLDVRFMNMPGAKMHYMLRGNKTGYYTIDVTSGWIMDAEVERGVQGVAIISSMISGQMQSAQWPLEVKEIVRVKRRSAVDSTAE
jgi:hypothetical protein